MTEKRFTFDKYSNLYDNELDACYGIANSKEAETLCDMLNALHDENEQLKSDATTLIYHNREYRKEIESLKEENKFLQNKVATYKTGNRLLKKTFEKE